MCPVVNCLTPAWIVCSLSPICAKIWWKYGEEWSTIILCTPIMTIANTHHISNMSFITIIIKNNNNMFWPWNHFLLEHLELGPHHHQSSPWFSFVSCRRYAAYALAAKPPFNVTWLKRRGKAPWFPLFLACIQNACIYHYVYIYIYVYVCKYIFIYKYVYVYIYVDIYCIHLYICICILYCKHSTPGKKKKNKMKPTNPNAHTYVNGTDVKTHGYAVTHNTFLQ